MANGAATASPAAANALMINLFIISSDRVEQQSGHPEWMALSNQSGSSAESFRSVV
jgi:hypothetical protein